MKKAKIALSAIALLAVVGGAFAFKATRIQNVFYTSTVAGGACNVPTLTTLTTTNVGGFQTRLATTPTTLPCGIITVTTAP